MSIDGPTLKRLRVSAGLTQRQLAKLTGISQAHIAKIESGKVDPRLSTVNKILRVLTEGVGKKCSDIMTRNVICVRPEDTIKKVSELMIRHAISQLPVVNHGRVVGTVTEECIIRNLRPTIADERVDRVMQPPLPMVPEDTDLNTVRTLLEAHPGVLVVSKGNLVGIITRSDLLRIISTEL